MQPSRQNSYIEPEDKDSYLKHAHWHTDSTSSLSMLMVHRAWILLEWSYLKLVHSDATLGLYIMTVPHPPA